MKGVGFRLKGFLSAMTVLTATSGDEIIRSTQLPVVFFRHPLRETLTCMAGGHSLHTKLSICAHLFNKLVFVATLTALNLLSPAPIAQAAPPALPYAATDPTTPGIFYFVDSTGTNVSLEFKTSVIDALAIAVSGERSSVRFPAGTLFKFTALLPSDKKGVPVHPVMLQFESANGWRTVKLEFAGNQRRVKQNPSMRVVALNTTPSVRDVVSFTPTAPLRPGEYCLATNSKDGKDAYCFGVDEASGGTDLAQASSPGAASPATPAMTNADVVKMISAGLSPDVVSGFIRQANAPAFDLSMNGLLSLKKSKVPDSVVVAMQQSAAQPAPPPPSTSTAQASAPAQATGSVPDARIPIPTDFDIFYAVTPSGKLQHLEALKAERVTDADFSHRSEMGYKVFGAKSGVRFATGSVVLVVKLTKSNWIADSSNPDYIKFRRWEPTTAARQTWYSTGPVNRRRKRNPDQGEFEYSTVKLGETTFKVTPDEPLIPGEYCITAGLFDRPFCFGVDGSR